LSTLFHYVRSRRRTALNLCFGMLVLPGWLWLFATLGEGRAGLEAFMAVAVPVVVAVEVVMALFVLWLLTHPARFEIMVTPTLFEVHHPTFTQWCFSIVPTEIRRIEHRLDVHGFSSILIHRVAGRPLSLCMNYNYSRQRLYDALRSVNPGIDMPPNILGFQRRRRA